MQVATDVPEPEWRAFLDHEEHSSIFQSPEMAKVYRGTKGYSPRAFFVKGRDGIEALLSSVLIDYLRSGVTRLATRSLVVGGPLGNSRLYASLFSAYDGFASKHAMFTEIRNLATCDNSKPFLDAGYLWEDHLNFLIDLKNDERGLLSGMSRERRKGIRKAQQNGVEVTNVKPGQLQTCYQVLQETYSKARVPLADISLFESALQHLDTINAFQMWGATHEGRMCAVRFILAWRSTIFDWYAGSTEEGRDLRANDLIVWEILRSGREQGYQQFDFGGAGRPQQSYGPGEFKRTFGGELINPGRFVKVHHPLGMKLSTKAYDLWRRVR